MRSERFETPGPLRIKIQIPSGDVELETVDGTTAEVELEGPEELVEEARIELRPKGDGHELVVETHRRSGFRIFRGDDVELRIRAPHGADVQVSAASADIEGRGRFGEVEVEAASGDISLERVDRDAKAQTASGDIEIEQLGGAGKLQSASGDISVGEAAGSLKVSTASGDQEIGSVAAGEIALQTASGDIEVGIKRGAKVFIDARSMSGETSSDLEVGDALPDGDGPVVEVKATAMSGDIRIRRS
jgi:Putative adhesin